MVENSIKTSNHIILNKCSFTILHAYRALVCKYHSRIQGLIATVTIEHVKTQTVNNRILMARSFSHQSNVMLYVYLLGNNYHVKVRSIYANIRVP